LTTADRPAPQWSDAEILEALNAAYEKKAKRHAALARSRTRKLFIEDDDE